MSEKLGDGLKKILLAGIGAVAATAEKSQEILNELVKKGELTIEEGKVLNEELKHDLKDRVKDTVSVTVSTSDVEKLSENLGKLSAEELEMLKKKVEEAQGRAEQGSGE